MKKTFIVLAITSCFVWCTTLANANPGSSQGNIHEQMFKDMDTNSDATVTKEEFNNYGAKKFKELDANGDGQVTGEEMKTAHKKVDGSRNVRNKMNDSGRESKNKEHFESNSVH